MTRYLNCNFITKKIVIFIFTSEQPRENFGDNVKKIKHGLDPAILSYSLPSVPFWVISANHASLEKNKDTDSCMKILFCMSRVLHFAWPF